jgi:hypothetical protein
LQALHTFLVFGNLNPRQLVSRIAGLFFSGLGTGGGGGEARALGDAHTGVTGDNMGAPQLSSADVAWFDAPLLLRPLVRLLQHTSSSLACVTDVVI